MAGSINFNMRMDAGLKERAFPVFESYGLTPAQALKLFLNQVAETKTIPLSFSYNADRIPNVRTKKIIEQAEAEFGTSERYNTVDEAIQAMREFAHD